MTHDRTGEPVDDGQPDRRWHDPRCRNGWLSPPDADVAIVCTHCRPDARPSTYQPTPRQQREQSN
jgi:hypothetical protein